MMNKDNNQRLVCVALVKAVPVEANREANFQTLKRLSQPLIGKNVDVLITPECFLDGYMVKNDKWSRNDLKANSEPGEQGKYVQKLKQLARDLNCYLVAGLSECVDGEHIRNTAYLFDRSGEIQGKYYTLNFESDTCNKGGLYW